MPRHHLGWALLLATACGGSPTGPTPPATPTGTILAMATNGDLWLLDPETGDTSRLSTNGVPLGWVNSTLGPKAEVAAGANYLGPRSIRLVHLPTLEITEILALGADQSSWSIRISPDGKQLAFASLSWVAPGELGVATIDIATRITQIRWVAPADNPDLILAELHWLPDQTALLAVVEDGSGPKWLGRLELATGELTAIVPPREVNRIATLDLSPNGRTIAYTLEDDAIQFVNLDGTTAPGFPSGLRGTFPAFSPDGRVLAFSRYADDSPRIIGIWYYRFSDGKLWRALPEGHLVTWVRDWE